jgi:regulator of RNase E activity RraA
MSDVSWNGAAPSEIARRLAATSASMISDVTAGQRVVSPGLIRFSGSGTVAGRAVTAECAPGSLMAIFRALDQSRPGDVLCTTAPGSTAYLGDLLAHEIANRGLAAVVVDGLVRDRDTLAGMSVSFFARGVTPMARRGREPGRSMIPIEVGGVTVHPGDWIMADSDGVVVVAPDEVEQALAKAEADTRLEEQMLARIKAGTKLMDAVNEVLGS